MDNIRRHNFCGAMFALCIVIFVTAICEIGGTSEPPKSFLGVEAILEGWESNYGSIRSMEVSYTYQLLDFKPPATNPDFSGLVRYQHLERVEEGKRYHTRYSTAKNGFIKSENLMENSFDGEITREYSAMDKAGMICSGLIGRDVETMNVLKQFMLLDTARSRKYAEEYPEGIPRFSLFLRSPKAKVLPLLEPVAGQLCHLVEIIDKTERTNNVFKIWVAHERGMLPLKYQHYLNNVLTIEHEVEEIGYTETDGQGIWYPKEVYQIQNRKTFGTMKFQLTTHKFVPNIKTHDNTFRFDFPNGTRIWDKVADIQYTVGIEDIDDVATVRELGKTSVEEKATPSPAVIDNEKDKQENETRAKPATAKDKNRILGIKSFSILGVVALVVFGLLLCYKQRVKT
jgi:hypothetical protein